MVSYDIYSKKLTICLLNLAQKTFLSKKSFFDVIALVNWQKMVIRININ
jgi:hypothetical protein